MRRLAALPGRIPAAARWCALAAFLNTLVWAVITPPFQVPDETVHVVYAQHLAETGDIPDANGKDPFSPEMHAVLDALRFNQVVGRPRDRATSSDFYDDGVQAVIEDPPGAVGPGGSVGTSNQPPLFYGLAAGAYLVSPWQDLLHRLWLMRIVSALLAAVTTLLIFMFLREVLSQPWTWTVGALAVAFQPMFTFISGGVHADSLYAAACAGLLFGLARAFRGGLTVSRGIGIGAALGVGLLTKLSFVAVIPGALLGVGLLAWRAGAGRPAGLRGAAAAVGVLAAAAVLYAGLNVAVFDRPATGWVTDDSVVAAAPEPAEPVVLNRNEQLSYTWQLYLPRLPFMEDQFTYYPAWQTFFKGGIGVFGWLDTAFAPWAYTLAAVIAIPLLVLLLVALWTRRAVLLARWPELLAYSAIALGVLVAIGFSGAYYRKSTGFIFEQARYLLPLLPLYAAAVALAARGVGARFDRRAGAVIVSLAMAHGLFAQLLVVSRYYG